MRIVYFLIWSPQDLMLLLKIIKTMLKLKKISEIMLILCILVCHCSWKLFSLNI
jgi:hypothetical protein